MRYEHGEKQEWNGKVHTLVTLPISAWMPTDDVDTAVAMFGRKLERAFGPMEWDDDSETNGWLTVAAAMRRHPDER